MRWYIRLILWKIVLSLPKDKFPVSVSCNISSARIVFEDNCIVPSDNCKPKYDILIVVKASQKLRKWQLFKSSVNRFQSKFFYSARKKTAQSYT